MKDLEKEIQKLTEQDAYLKKSIDEMSKKLEGAMTENNLLKNGHAKLERQFKSFITEFQHMKEKITDNVDEDSPVPYMSDFELPERLGPM